MLLIKLFTKPLGSPGYCPWLEVPCASSEIYSDLHGPKSSLGKITFSLKLYKSLPLVDPLGLGWSWGGEGGGIVHSSTGGLGRKSKS